MSADLKAYEVLGVKPGVSNKELKAAHRDLAKVWHPDRFLHDPRLQAKAQEKLKEINQAYEQLISGKNPWPVKPAPQRAERAHSAPSPRAMSWYWIALPLLVFLAVFVVTNRGLQQKRIQGLQEQEAQAEQSDTPHQDAKQPDSSSRAEVNDAPRKANREEPAPEATPAQIVITQPTPALGTVTVMIDPQSGLLAKPDCPVRSRMTYPSGSQPTSYCNISHAPPPKESRIKSLATKILPQRRKEAKGTQDP